MKILLDECVSRKVKSLLVEHEVFTVTEIGLSGFKNGNLLARAESEGFDILLTIDKNMSSQQSISKFNLTLVVLDVFRSNIKYLSPLIPSFLNQIDSFQRRKVYIIS